KVPGHRGEVSGCLNSRIGTKISGESIIFHTFPKRQNLTATKMQKEMVQRCKRRNDLNPKNSIICSIHFTENDYELNFKNDVLSLHLKKKLKKTAVPTLHLPA